MSTETKPTTDPQEQADAEAILRHAFHGEPLDAEVDRRVQERADKITERLRAEYGVIDDDTFQKLLDDDEET
jgi:transcriptional regulator of met regulon